MSIDELIALLKQHKHHVGGECPVLVAWEGAVRVIKPSHIYPEEARALWVEDPRTTDVLLIDVDAQPE